MSRNLCKAGQHRLHGLLPIQREHGSVSLLFQGHAQNAKGVRFLDSAILVPCFLNTKVLGCFVFRDLEQQKDSQHFKFSKTGYMSTLRPARVPSPG